MPCKIGNSLKWIKYKFCCFYLQVFFQGFWMLTFILRCEFLHFWRQRFIKALFPGYERFAHSVVIVAHHAAVAAHLMDERLQQDPSASCVGCVLAMLPHLHGLTNTHCVGRKSHTWGMGRAACGGRSSFPKRKLSPLS